MEKGLNTRFLFLGIKRDFSEFEINFQLKWSKRVKYCFWLIFDGSLGCFWDFFDDFLNGGKKFLDRNI